MMANQLRLFSAHRVWVCGSASYEDEEHIDDVLSGYNRETPIEMMIVAGRPGVEAVARRWAEEAGILLATIKPAWKLGEQALGLHHAMILEALSPSALLVIADDGHYFIRSLTRFCTKSRRVKVFEHPHRVKPDPKRKVVSLTPEVAEPSGDRFADELLRVISPHLAMPRPAEDDSSWEEP